MHQKIPNYNSNTHFGPFGLPMEGFGAKKVWWYPLSLVWTFTIHFTTTPTPNILALKPKSHFPLEKCPMKYYGHKVKLPVLISKLSLCECDIKANCYPKLYLNVEILASLLDLYPFLYMYYTERLVAHNIFQKIWMLFSGTIWCAYHTQYTSLHTMLHLRWSFLMFS